MMNKNSSNLAMNLLSPCSAWFIRQSKWLFPLYATIIFSMASIVLIGAYHKDEYSQLLSQGVLTFLTLIILSLLIIQLGFSAPNLSHVSFDRVTQIGLIWIFGPASAALIGAFASLIYPILNANLKKRKIQDIFFSAIHNAGMFGLCIYLSGYIYQAVGGEIPLRSLDLSSVVPVSVMFLSMQILNSILFFMRTLISSGRILEKADWVTHGIEFVATLVALLFALIYINNDRSVTLLFVIFLMTAIYSAKYLNKITLALSKKVEQVVTLSSIAKAISSTFLLNDVTQEIFKECARIFRFDYFYLGVINQKTKEVEFQPLQQSHEKPNHDEKYQSGKNHRLIRYILESDKNLFIESLSESFPENKFILERPSYKAGSFVGVPIYFNKEILGVIAIESQSDGAFSRSDFKFIQSLANHVGVAIKNANLFQQLEERKEELEQKVLRRTAQIEDQKNALTELNQNLELANQRKDEILVTLQKTATELDRQCRQDALTGLYNRRHIDEYLEREIERIRRSSGVFSIGLLDIDFFKRVNDDFSHSVGDVALQKVATILMEHVRGMDTVARIGGEEILICLPDTNQTDAAVICERLRQAIQSFNWDSVAVGLKITASIGVAEFDAAMSKGDFIQRSDEKLYEAKHKGRNQVCS